MSDRRLGFRIGVAVVLAGGLAACGGGGEDVTQFIGTWMYTSGTETISCPGREPVTGILTGNVTLAKGIESPLVATGKSCTIKLDVAGNTATARPGQTCPLTLNTVTGTTAVTNYMFSVNGITGTEGTGATIAAMAATGGPSVTCQYTGTGTLKKVSQ